MGLLANEHAAIRKELSRLPAAVYQAYDLACPLMEQRLAENDVMVWARHGVSVAQSTVRSWEAAAEYFRVSPVVIRDLSFPQFIRWAKCGGSLCLQSPTISTAFFRASPESLVHLQAKDVSRWADTGLSLYKGTWKSSALACKFFEASPELLQWMHYREIDLFASMLGTLSQRSFDMATQCLQLGLQIFPKIRGHQKAFITLTLALVETSWPEIRGCFEAVKHVASSVEEAQQDRFLLLARRMASNGVTNVSGFLIECSGSMGRIAREYHKQLLDMSEALAEHSIEAVPAFMNSALRVIHCVGDDGLEGWFGEGLAILKANPDGGIAYFKLESGRAEEVLDQLSYSVELERIREIMRLYCRALAGTGVDIKPTKDLVSKGVGWLSEEQPSTEGSTVFLPAIVDRYPTKAENFSWLKVVSTHQVAHIEFGSFDFVFERPSVLFENWRPGVEVQGTDGHVIDVINEVGDGECNLGEALTDMSRFFDLFANRRLALDIFTIVEDSRLDYLVKWDYPGIASSYARVQEEALKERSSVADMPLQQAMVELLVRLSLYQFNGFQMPRDHMEETRIMVKIARQILHPDAVVEDSAEATLRIYAIISKLPNNEVPLEEWEHQDFDQEEYSDEDLVDLLGRLDEQAASNQLSLEDEATEQPYQPPPLVEYRGEFKPEMTQLLSELRKKSGEKSDADVRTSITNEQLEELLKLSAEVTWGQGEDSFSTSVILQNLIKEAGLQPNLEHRQGHGQSSGDDGGSFDNKDSLTFVYDEWDFRAADYKPRWCVVREKVLDEGNVEFFSDTLRNYAGLVSQIRRQFEMVIPETFRKIKRLEDGEDIDLDAAIEAMVDKCTGNSPTEKTYWRRNKVKRDVAVLLLLDMSASTAEAIDEKQRWGVDLDAPDDPVEYMNWLRSRRGHGARRSYKRIIDVEKESLVLMTNALEAIGDEYGIYGFSGYGRENVEFYVIKDLAESFSERVRKRMEKITPLHATRMGPAIRHAVTKLEGRDARTKILFLISDGRPQDRSYSREGVEKEYAVHDTKMALTEARRKRIIPFCLTVDKSGHDYLKTMCSDIGYEVLADITALPRRLPLLYRRLTI